jgi:tetratricopeptide (TPR) repeat protein
VSNVVVPLKAIVAERFLYPVLPCAVAGLAVALALAFERGRPALRLATGAVVLGALGVLVAATARRDASWRDDETLWDAVRAEDPTNARAYEGLGFVHLHRGRLEKAERAYRTFREWQPDDGKALAQLGDLYREVARTLETDDPELLATSNVGPKRDFALAASIRAYQEALTTWGRVGLVRGRGSPELRRATLERLREGAIALFDFDNAKQANDLLALDDLARGGAVAYAQRRVRPLLASLVVQVPGGAPGGPSADRAATRRRVLADVGVAAHLSDVDAAEALLPVLSAHVAERPDDLALRNRRVDLVLTVVARRERPGAAAVPWLQAALEDLDAMSAAAPDDETPRRLRSAVVALLERERRR